MLTRIATRPSDERAFPVLAAGTIVDSTASTARFTLDDWSSTRVFGPAPFHAPVTTLVQGGTGDAQFELHRHLTEPPPPGARCLVAFPGTGPEGAWVISWQ